jgi:hypothetical protein
MLTRRLSMSWRSEVQDQVEGIRMRHVALVGLLEEKGVLGPVEARYALGRATLGELWEARRHDEEFLKRLGPRLEKELKEMEDHYVHGRTTLDELNAFRQRVEAQREQFGLDELGGE